MALRKVGCFVRPQNNSHVSLVRIIVAEVTVGLSLCFIISGNSADVVNNPACIGEYTFIQFIASAVCHRNPLTSGRYLGIKTTKRGFLQLCEVEVYSRGNGLMLKVCIALNQLPLGLRFNGPFRIFSTFGVD